tara:strand:- start:4345 stop:4845 length:501 start_codon:yes stop_codon:yes gene_type:complete
MAAGAQNLFRVQPSNVGLGAGVRPTAPMAGLSVQTATTKTPQSWFSGPNTIDPGVPQLGYAPIMQTPQVSTIDSGTTYSANDVTELQKSYDDQEKIRQAQQNKLMELATMGDDTPQTSIRPQMVGANPAASNIKAIASGPVKRRKGRLGSAYFEGLYPKSSGGMVG